MIPASAQPREQAPPALRSARVAFAGRLASMTLAEARRVTRAAGAEAASVVTRRTSLLVLGQSGWPLAADGAPHEKLRRAEELNRSARTLRVVAEHEFLDLAGQPQRKDKLNRRVAPEALCRLLAIAPDALDRWHQHRLLADHQGEYALGDVLSLQALAAPLDRGASPAVIASSLRFLARWLPGTDAALAQLHGLAAAPLDIRAELAAVEPTPDGQLQLGFDRPDDTGNAPTIIRFDRALRSEDGTAVTSGEWFDLAHALEEEERYNEAADAYRRAIGQQGRFPEALFNLGTILHTTGKAEAAVELYRLALAQDSDFAAAWYNLADTLEAQGRIGEAVEALQAALRANPSYADAHYNLALLYERAGDGATAKRHWEGYVKLDPHSEWGRAATQRLAGPEPG